MTPTALNDALQELIAQCSEVFESKTEGLTAYQMNFLTALAHGVTTGLTSAQVLTTYKLGSSANVAIVKKTLLERDFIVVDETGIRLSDPIMGLWLNQ